MPEPQGGDLFGAMAFRHDWRTYQRLILDLFEARDPARRTFHVVAPPGSGKTLVGLEIARRIGRPAVTFSPTTTIQDQWRDKVRLFIPGDASADRIDKLMGQVSTDATGLAAISNLTYQSLSTQTQDREFLDRLGLRAWRRELGDAGRDEPSIDAYLADVRARSPDTYRREVARRAVTEKRRALAAGEVELHDLLHANARDLIDRIVAAGTGLIVLDEAHHLLDYWALILRDLIDRLPDALVVGLTATPPASAAPTELDNYLALVGEIDFEVPTPAVVRSGFLAPYQDLIMFTQPSARERTFLARQDEMLRGAIASMRDDPRFDPWLATRIDRPPSGTGTRRSWSSLLSEEFEFAIAGVRYRAAAGAPLAPDIELTTSLRAPVTLDDELAILRTYALDVLRLSDDPADATRLADLRALLRTLGLAFTETGWRSTASTVDRVLAYSESKVEAAADILALEHEAMGDRLRAVVLTDHERSAALATRQLRGVLDAESGGAVRVIRRLVGDRTLVALDPVMVTGRTVLVGAGSADRARAALQAHLDARAARATVTVQEIEPGLVELAAEGDAWRPRNYVAALTGMLERGEVQVLVGTRGLLAEGWDSLTLNTLIDLTTAGTSASVNQIRGRSIRLDPSDPRKVANNWDVVTYEPKLGDADVRRLVGKHAHTFGLGPGDRIIKGIGHVDERIPFLGLPMVAMATGATATPDAINTRSRRRALDRAGAYERWRIGSEYDNLVFTGTVLDQPVRPIRTAFTWGRSLRALLSMIIGVIVLVAVVGIRGGVPSIATGGPSALLAVIVIAGIAGVIASIPLAWRYVRAAFIELPVDSFLADFGRAVAEAYREIGTHPMSTDQVRVRVTEEQTYEVVLDSRDGPTVAAFAEAYRELFDPIIDQRYLIERNEADISGTFYAPIWYVFRRLFRAARRRDIAYHAVPTAFARRREDADVFARAWRRWVGGGSLVYTRSRDGAEILLRERVARRTAVRATSFEAWR